MSLTRTASDLPIHPEVILVCVLCAQELERGICPDHPQAKFRSVATIVGADHAERDWVIAPGAQHRDSDALERSNARVARAAYAAIDPDGVDHEVLSFGHFAVGWVEEIVVRPGSACATEAERLADRLADYPVLSDDDYSAEEQSDLEESWPAIVHDARVELVRAAKERGVSERDRDAIEDLSDDTIGEILSAHSDGPEDGWQSISRHEISGAVTAALCHVRARGAEVRS